MLIDREQTTNKLRSGKKVVRLLQGQILHLLKKVPIEDCSIIKVADNIKKLSKG